MLRKPHAVSALIECGAAVTLADTPLVEMALTHQDFDSATDLVKHGAVISLANVFKIIYAGCLYTDKLPVTNHTEVFLKFLQILIDKGYKANEIWFLGQNEDSPSGFMFLNKLVYQAENGRVLELFIKNGANPNQHSDVAKIMKANNELVMTPLAQAIDCSNKDVVQMLLNAGADINQKSRSNFNDSVGSPLALAIAKNKNDIVELLLEHGASL